MLKGHVFSRQIFGNPIFALFIDIFLGGKCGVAGNYKEKMQVSYSGNTLTVSSGCVCIRGRFLEEDTNTQIAAGTDNSYCSLVIEVDLSKTNTDTEFKQATYKIIKGASSYPTLTKNDIVANNTGIYQYELARFRTSASGITEFQDRRTYLDFDSIYSEIEQKFNALSDEKQTEAEELLNQLRDELAEVQDGSAFVLKSKINIVKELPTEGLVNGDIYFKYFE